MKLINLLLFLISAVFFFPELVLSSREYDYRFKNCSNYFDCGTIKYLGYPFWGNGRAQYCGLRGYYLECKDGSNPIIEISSFKYQILTIDQETGIMRISRDDFMKDPCPSDYLNSTIDLNLFNNTPGTINLTLFYGCTHYSAEPFHTQNRFACDKESGTDAYYFRNPPPEDVITGMGCKWRIVAPVEEAAVRRLENGESTVNDVLRGGFVVKRLVNISRCEECGESGGVCGYDQLVLKQNTCFCYDAAHQDKCPTRPPLAVTRGRLEVTIATSIIGALMVFMVVVIVYFQRRKRSRKNSPKMEEFLKNFGSLAPKRYKYSDIRKMTNSFQDKLGQGGYGSVFKGQLQDGRMVAVKLLNETKGNNNNNDGEEFVNEVASISRTSHVNIVMLLGFCVEGPKRALIYEFMPNGSLEKFIYMKNSSKKDGALHQLGWDTLYKIAIGIARGLEYLHRGCYMQIVHFDIKPHNILLDQDFSPKISDFGLAKLCLRKESVMSTIGARGTIGYIAPELVSRTFGRVSHKSDVYSYGMMMLEMVGGRKNVDVEADNTSEIYFPHWIYNQLDHQSEEMRSMGGIMIQEDKEIARKLIIVGLWCIQIDPSIRPPMNKVLEMLGGSLEDLQIPPKPCFSSLSRPQETNCSDISIFDVI